MVRMSISGATIASRSAELPRDTRLHGDVHRTNVITNTGFDPNEARDKAGKWTRIAVEESAAFKKWFGSSKVVDKDGKPLVVYHGSSRGKIPDIVKAPYF